MTKYHKIQTVFKRDPSTNHRTLIHGNFSLDEFSYLAPNNWEFTEKVDGTNIRLIWDGSSVEMRGKTDNAQLPNSLVLWLEENREKIEQGLVETFRACQDVVIYGEGYGPNIHGGGKYRPDASFVAFDILVEGIWLRQASVVDICQSLGIDTVPVIGYGTLYDMVEKAKTGFNSRWGNFLAEGIVARPIEQLFTRDGKRIITKVKCKDFR